MGPQGYQGYQGLTGPQGLQGVQGATGVQGYQGLTGPQGSTGAQGTQGVQGTQGNQGNQGNQGPTDVVTSSSAPTNTSVLWLDTSATGSGTQGPQGAQGTTGSQGPTGVQGAQGNQGLTGPQGAQGVQGFQGVQGSTGSQGFQGFQGVTGSQGSTGAQGATGSQGAQGNQGFQGNQGDQGTQGNQGNQGMYIQASSSGVPTTSLWADTSTVGSAVVPVGGLSGQVLNKNTNSDYDTGWVNPLVPAIGIPAMHGYLAWTCDPVVCSGQAVVMPSGGIYYHMIYLQQGMVISNISVSVGTAGSGLTNCYLGLYNSTTQLAVTAAITTAFQSTGIVKTAVTSPYTVPTTGYYYVSVLIGNASTTGPRFIAPSAVNYDSNTYNAGQTAASNTLSLRASLQAGSATVLPSTISGTPANGYKYAFWAGLN
jgi:hypothetical protein